MRRRICESVRRFFGLTILTLPCRILNSQSHARWSRHVDVSLKCGPAKCLMHMPRNDDRCSGRPRQIVNAIKCPTRCGCFNRFDHLFAGVMG